MVQSGRVRRAGHRYFGNAGRDIITAPGSATVNAGLFKNFPLPLREGMKLQFRSEFFNVLNRVNLGNPNMTLGSSMGRITSAGSARVLQFALKVLFSPKRPGRKYFGDVRAERVPGKSYRRPPATAGFGDWELTSG